MDLEIPGDGTVGDVVALSFHRPESLEPTLLAPIISGALLDLLEHEHMLTLSDRALRVHVVKRTS